MKTIYFVVLLALSALLFSACPPAQESVNSTPDNTNTTEEPAEDLTKALVATSTEAREAWKAKNGKFFEDFLLDSFVGVGGAGRDDKAARIASISGFPCDVKSISNSDEQSVELGEGVALLTLKTTDDADCNGKPMLSPSWTAVVAVKDGDKWKGAYHQVVPAADAKGEMPQRPAGAGDKAPEDSDKELTAKLSEIVKAGWEAWSKNDAKWFEDNTTDKYVAITNLGGREDRAARIKYHGEHKCEVESVTHDGQRATKISDNVVLLTYKSMVKGTCEGAAVPAAIWASSIFVKDGDGWKMAFYMGTPGV